jgi:hypothetical protein
MRPNNQEVHMQGFYEVVIIVAIILGILMGCGDN